jgi:hypothetical protein
VGVSYHLRDLGNQNHHDLPLAPRTQLGHWIVLRKAYLSMLLSCSLAQKRPRCIVMKLSHLVASTGVYVGDVATWANVLRRGKRYTLSEVALIHPHNAMSRFGLSGHSGLTIPPPRFVLPSIHQILHCPRSDIGDNGSSSSHTTFTPELCLQLASTGSIIPSQNTSFQVLKYHVLTTLSCR